jgi:hypothetical protein
VRLVYLKGEETLIARRIATRHEHFMPWSLLHSHSKRSKSRVRTKHPSPFRSSRNLARSWHRFCRRWRSSKRSGILEQTVSQWPFPVRGAGLSKSPSGDFIKDCIAFAT